MPEGGVAESAGDAADIARRLGGRCVVKAQVLTGGRGKAGGVKLVPGPSEARDAAERILSLSIKGHAVTRVLVVKAVAIATEYYAAFTVDRTAQCVDCILSRSGGMDIEEVAAGDPGKILTLPIPPLSGLPGDALDTHIAAVFGNSAAHKARAMLERMYGLFHDLDCSLVEVNPLAETDAGDLLAADAKVVFDDNALYKHPELEALRNAEEYSAEEIEAREAGLSFVQLDGVIGCMVNGAGLAMATMDLIKLCGSQPANFLDVGGSSNPDKVLTALKILLRNPRLKVILVNIFGGITRCDDIARGLLMARDKLDLSVPLVVRLIGTNEDDGRRLLEDAGIRASGSMTEAVEHAVALAEGQGTPERDS